MQVRVRLELKYFFLLIKKAIYSKQFFMIIIFKIKLVSSTSANSKSCKTIYSPTRFVTKINFTLRKTVPTIADLHVGNRRKGVQGTTYFVRDIILGFTVQAKTVMKCALVTRNA